MNNAETGRRQFIQLKQVIALIILYVCLVIGVNLYHLHDFEDNRIFDKINNQEIEVTPKSYLKQLFYVAWRGTVSSTSSDQKTDNKVLNMQMSIEKHSETAKSHYIMLNLVIKLGEYFQDGQIVVRTQRYYLNDMMVVREGDVLILQPKSEEFHLNGSAATYNKFQIKKQQLVDFTVLKFISEIKDNRIHRKLVFGRQEVNHLFEIIEIKSNFIGTFSLSLIFLFISVREFLIILSIHEKLVSRESIPSSYSFTTLLMATIWDALFCLFAFIQAFQSDINIIMFIFQTFIFFVTFMNLQVKVIIMIFKENNNSRSPTMLLFRFSFLFYSSFPILYAILYITNSEDIIILIFSLIYLPQIYTNAVHKKVCELSSPYISQFLLLRFLIILYLKRFPLNIYQFRPNIWVVLTVALILGLQLVLIKVQQIYGPRAVIPKICLPNTFSYESELTQITEQSESPGRFKQECSICLQSLQVQPKQIHQNEGHPKYPRYMITPCGHIFHGSCLVTWMNIKMACPNCRARLPVLE